MDNFSFFFTFDNHVYEKDKTKNTLIEISKNMNLLEGLYILSCIDLYLSEEKEKNLKSQVKIINYLFNPKLKDTIEINDFLKSKLLDKNNKIDLIFHHQQIYIAMSFLLKYGNEENKKFNIAQIGQILILINHLINDKAISLIDEGCDGINGYLWQTGQLLGTLRKNHGSEMARTYIVCENSKSTKSGHDFLKTFKKVIGIELDLFYKLFFYLSSYWVTKEDIVNNSDHIINIDNIFNNTKNVTKNDAIKFLDLFSTDIKSLRSINNKRLNQFENMEYNFNSLLEKPIIKISENRYFCLSLQFLIKRAFTDIQYLLKNLAYEKKIDLNKLNVNLGDSYEDYIKNILELTYNKPSLNIKRCFFSSFNNIQISDAVIDYGDSVLFIEVKAKQIKKRHRVSSEKQNIYEALEIFILKKGKPQLAKRIIEFMTNKTIIKEIDSKRVKYYYPIIISCVEEIPKFITLNKTYKSIERKHFSNLCKSLNIKYNEIENKIKPITFISLKELEFILDIVDKGHNFKSILDEKINNYFDYDFWNYLRVIKKFEYNRPKNIKNKLEKITKEFISNF